ncbi:hypothetical protein [Mesonia aquimarina]|uniref:hypothetical protein n=1 Tax=Mesonia aquimarina TaxID=1504967 RepID=UPI000EF5A12E|nr:hypothetical protein [Mesonia aquimarina]
MNDLINSIHLLTKKEQEEFKKIQLKKNKISSTKNIELFKLLATKKNTEEELNKFYTTDNRNAFYALSKRLQDNLIDFIAQKGFEKENSIENEILKGFLAARIFFEHKMYNLGFKLLWRIEKKAIAFELYPILNEIYATALQNSHFSNSINFEEISTRAQENFNKVEMEFRLNLAYAEIQQQLRSSTNIDDLIKTAFAKHQIEISKHLSYKSLNKLFKIFHVQGKYETNYFSISPYLESLYKKIDHKKHLSQKHLFYHVEILVIMSYAAFRKRDFKYSKQYLQNVKSILKENNNKFYKHFQEDIILLEAYQLNFTNQAQKAIAILENYEDDSFFRDLFLITCYIQQNLIKEAYKKFLQLKKSDLYYEKKYGWIWVFKKNIIELILLIELDKLDVFSSRILSFKRKFFPQLKSDKKSKPILFVEALQDFYDDKISKAKKKCEKIQVNSEKEEDVFNLCFYAWLHTKIEKPSSSLYENTLSLLNT